MVNALWEKENGGKKIYLAAHKHKSHHWQNALCVRLTDRCNILLGTLNRREETTVFFLSLSFFLTHSRRSRWTKRDDLLTTNIRLFFQWRKISQASPKQHSPFCIKRPQQSAKPGEKAAVFYSTTLAANNWLLTNRQPPFNRQSTSSHTTKAGLVDFLFRIYICWM